MKNLFHYYTFWAIFSFIALFGLVSFPETNKLILSLYGIVWLSYFPNIIPLAIGIDIYKGRLKTIFLILLLAPYIIYYSFFSYELFQLKSVESEIRRQNPEFLITYDPNVHSLVFEREFGYVISQHQIPNFYTYHGEQYTAHRLVSKKLCDRLDWRHSNFRKTDYNLVFPKNVYGHVQTMARKKFENLCILNSIEVPYKKIIHIEKKQLSTLKPKLSTLKVEQYIFTLEGKEIGRYKIGTYYDKMRVLPSLVFGCPNLHIKTPHNKCILKFTNKMIKLNVAPKGFHRNTNKYGDWPVSHLLQIKKYTIEGLEQFQDFAENENFINLQNK